MALKKEEAVITEVLKMIAPGTPIRDGLENILKAITGAFLGLSDEILFPSLSLGASSPSFNSELL